VPVRTDRASLAVDLRSYGEDELAARVDGMSDEDLVRVFERADHYLALDESGLIAKGLALAAVEVLEGAARPLRRKRRRLKGVYPERARGAVPAGGRTDSDSIDAFVRTIADRKQLPRSAPGPEPPREVFAHAAAEIARHFEPSGWRFARSGPHLSRKAGPFTMLLSLSSSAYNAPGTLVVLGVAALVRSSALKRCRSQQPAVVGYGDAVAAGLLHNLTADRLAFDWNLADPAGRADTIADCIAHIEALALPWFGTFADTDRLVEHLRSERMPNMWAGVAIEVLVWLERRDAATEHARLWLTDPRVAASCERELRRLDGLPPTGDEYQGDDGEQIARAINAYGLV
jgi:hypothetical protein